MRKFMILLISGLTVFVVGFGSAHPGFDLAQPPDVVQLEHFANKAVLVDTTVEMVDTVKFSQQVVKLSVKTQVPVSQPKTVTKGKVKIRDAIKEDGPGHNAVGCSPEC
jgi:hypothetical protein